jgi:hypothetical protein
MDTVRALSEFIALFSRNLIHIAVFEGNMCEHCYHDRHACLPRRSRARGVGIFVLLLRHVLYRRSFDLRAVYECSAC